MARCVLGLFLVGATGCLWPPPLEELRSDGAAGNHPPVLRKDLTLPPFAQTKTVYQSEPGKLESTDLNIAFDDPDKQVITIRLFLDRKYDAVVRQETVTTYLATSAVIITLNGLCDQPVNFVAGRHDLEVYISDSGFVDSGTDLRRINSGGYRDNNLWAVDCIPPQSK